MFSLSTKFSPASANFEKAIFAGYENAELYMTPTRLMSWKSLSKIARSFDLNYVLHFPTEGKIGWLSGFQPIFQVEFVGLMHRIPRHKEPPDLITKNILNSIA